MSLRRLALRLAAAAVLATSSATGVGVLLGPATPDPALSSAGSAEAVDAGSRPSGAALPEVTEQVRADFTAGDDLPDGSQFFDAGSNRSGMTVSEGLLVHGAPVGPGAAGFMEARLASSVRSLGARVRFSDADSGSVALVGWKSSLVEAARAGEATPRTGLRLVGSPGRWELSVVDGAPRVIGSGTFEPASGVATFEVRRAGHLLYVLDPEGTVTVVKDKRAARLAGPWASWGLTETGPAQAPAAIEAVWAG